jgi:hypothetical protein
LFDFTFFAGKSRVFLTADVGGWTRINADVRTKICGSSLRRFWQTEAIKLTIRPRSPLAPLKEGGDKIPIKVPLLKGDLGGSRLGDKREIKRVLVSYRKTRLTQPFN